MLVIPHAIESVNPQVGSQSGSQLVIFGYGFSEYMEIIFTDSEDRCVISEAVLNNRIVCQAPGTASGDVEIVQANTTVLAGINYQATLAPVLTSVTPTNLAGPASIVFTLDQITGIDILKFDVILFNDKYTKEIGNFTRNGNQFTIEVNTFEAGTYDIQILLDDFHFVDVGSF